MPVSTNWRRSFAEPIVGFGGELGGPGHSGASPGSRTPPRPPPFCGKGLPMARQQFLINQKSGLNLYTSPHPPVTTNIVFLVANFPAISSLYSHPFPSWRYSDNGNRDCKGKPHSSSRRMVPEFLLTTVARSSSADNSSMHRTGHSGGR